MRIEKVTVAPVPKALESTLRFDVSVRFQEAGQEAPLGIVGELLADDEVELARLTTPSTPTHEENLEAADPARGAQTPNCVALPLVAVLGAKALDHLDVRRHLGANGDVRMSLRLSLSVLVSRAVLASFKFVKCDPPLLPRRKAGEADLFDVQFQHSPKPAARELTSMWVLSGDGGPRFASVYTYQQSHPVTIAASDWVRDFCPALGLGRFLVLEYPIPSLVAGTTELHKRLAAALDSLRRMEAKLRAGEWTETVEESRKIAEVLKHQGELRTLFLQDGHTEPAWNDLNGVLQSFFNYSSKFHHRQDQSKKLVPETRAWKEDAEFVFAACAGILSQLARKLHRHP